MRFYFKYHCYVNLFGFLFGGFYDFILDVYLDFRYFDFISTMLCMDV